MILSATVHHPTTRIACHDCGSRVFAYATDTANQANYCPPCANRRRGITLCRGCAQPINVNPVGVWVHTDGKLRRHPVTPEVARTAGSWADTLTD